MKVLIVGAAGTLGKYIASQLSGKHQIISAGRNSGDVHVDIRSKSTIEQMYREVGSVDACICVAESGALDDFENLTDEQLLENMRGKFFGQVNLVLIGKKYLADNGSFTLTSGIFADEPWQGVTGGGVVSGALHSFVLSAAIELKRGLRINIVSPSLIEDSKSDYGHLFPGMNAVPMDMLANAYTRCVEGQETGEIIRVYR